jgi:lanthionine synthetase-like protein/alpha-L-fucosidase-like protein
MRPAAITLAWLVVLAIGARAQEPASDRFARRPETPYLDAAIQIAKWLEGTAVKTKDGWAWPAAPDEFAGREVPKEKFDRSLYSGSAGIVLFGMQLGFATQTNRGTDSWPLAESPFLHLPRESARELLASLPEKVTEAAGDDDGERFGLYTGIAGTGFALYTLSQAIGWVEGHAGARRCVELLENGARGAGAGIEWSETTDVISGTAGIGLFLVFMAERDHLPLARDLAVAAGRRLLELGEREAVGRSWKMDRKFPRVMPNFSHGTAGVAFFLARLYELTGDDAFLDGALDGARHLLSIADTSNNGCRIYHDTPDNRDLYYLGWCHGPIGTAQLFMKLAQVTGDADWTDWARRCAESVRTSGIPEQTTSGFWNNVGLCCGSAGVAGFFETLVQSHRSFFEIPLRPIAADDPDQLFAKRLLDWTLAHGTQDDRGLRFIQAEHRVKPDLLQAQVGLMQGAAGVGLALLQFESIPPMRLLDLPDAARAFKRDSVGRALIVPEQPAERPNPTTTAFENLGRAVLFAPAPLLATSHGWQKSLRAEPPNSLACETWFDGAEAIGAKLVLLQTRDAEGFGLWDSDVSDDDVAKDHPGKDLVAPFVDAARKRGLAVGLSLRIATWIDEPKAWYPWTERARKEIEELLTSYGPLALLRIEVPVEVDDWPHTAGDRFYEFAKSIAPHTLVEFVTLDTFMGGGRGPNGIQRIGAKSDGHYDPNYEGGRAPRRDQLWPTDVVADFEHGPIRSGGVAGPYLRTEASPDPDSPWRIVSGRRHYVPLQVELPFGRVEPKSATSKRPQFLPRDVPPPHFRSLREELEVAAARSRNVLLVVPFEADGSLKSETIAGLRELGR